MHKALRSEKETARFHYFYWTFSFIKVKLRLHTINQFIVGGVSVTVSVFGVLQPPALSFQTLLHHSISTPPNSDKPLLNPQPRLGTVPFHG